MFEFEFIIEHANDIVDVEFSFGSQFFVINLVNFLVYVAKFVFVTVAAHRLVFAFKVVDLLYSLAVAALAAIDAALNRASSPAHLVLARPFALSFINAFNDRVLTV